ncbi:ATP-binding cassette domain-containing protein [Paraburkholderia fungorum]|uniref:ATP-binding cassette domain-containing protein n=1 Tax=Paraburkholderia fungorum TaxID=134537 RepID=UPI00402BD470
MEMIQSGRAIAGATARGDNGETPILVESLSDLVTDQFALTIPAFRVAAGTMTAVIGPNGSGKSTLLGHLLGERSTAHGTVRVLGYRAGAVPVNQRHRIGVQLQEAGYNERYLVRDIRTLHERAYEVSRPDVFDAFGVDAVAKSRFGSLSSGEKQRVQLAMAMAHSPELLILDEPTSNLDPHFRQAFCRLLADMAQGNASFSCLVITHAAEVVAICDEILMLQAGSIAHHGLKDAIVLQQFGPVGCAFTGAADVRREAEQRLLRGGAIIRPKTTGDTLTVFGDEDLRAAALEVACQLPLLRFTVWNTNAADLLESINHG